MHLEIVIKCHSWTAVGSYPCWMQARSLQHKPLGHLKGFRTRHKSKQNSERHCALLPPANAHFPRVSPLHYNISTALLLPRLIICSSNGKEDASNADSGPDTLLLPRYAVHVLFSLHKKENNVLALCFISYSDSLKPDCLSKNWEVSARNVCVKHDPHSTFLDLTLTDGHPS